MTLDLSFQSFDNNALGHNPYNAYWLAIVSQLAYRDGQETNKAWASRVKSTARKFGFNAYCFNNKGAQAVMLVDSSKIILGFRGTEEESDWLDDLEAEKDSFYSYRVHHGFKSYFDRVWQPVKAERRLGRKEDQGAEAVLREEMAKGEKSLWITGHSLGAAAALLAAASCQLEESQIPVAGLYTYGQPRVSGQKFAKWYNPALGAKTFRYVHANDIVPRVPPRLFLFSRYTHVGQLKYFTEQGVLKDGYEVTYWLRFQDELRGAASDFLEPGLDSIKDHSLGDGYIPLVKKQLPDPAATPKVEIAAEPKPSAAPEAKREGKAVTPRSKSRAKATPEPQAEPPVTPATEPKPEPEVPSAVEPKPEAETTTPPEPQVEPAVKEEVAA